MRAVRFQNNQSFYNKDVGAADDKEPGKAAAATSGPLSKAKEQIKEQEERAGRSGPKT